MKDNFIFEDSIAVLGNPLEFGGIAIVMFVDLLGFSNETLKKWSGGQPVAALRSINEKIKSIQQVDRFPRRSEHQRHNYLPHVRTISDSVLVSFALPDRAGLYEYWVGLKVMSSALSIIWDTATSLGYTVRGGVEIGEVVWDAELFTGPGLIHSYNLETKVARWSRIVVGSNIVEKLRFISQGFWAENRNILRISEDGMVEMPYWPISSMSSSIDDFTARIEHIMKENEVHADKYRPLLRSLRGREVQYCNPKTLEIALEKYRIYR